MIKQKFNQFKKWFLEQPLWKRAVISSIIGAFGGTPVLVFINRFALYFYAYNQNIRLPLEEIDYLDLAVSLFSGGLLFIFIVSSIFFDALFSYVGNIVVEKYGIDNPERFKRFKLFSFGYSLFIFIIGQGFMFCLSWIFDVELKWESIFFKPHLFSLLWYIVTGIILVMIISRDKNSRRLSIFAIIGILYIVFTIFLFRQSFYSEFLKSIKYGGEIPIEIEYRKADNSESHLTGLLLIRTGKYVIIKDVDNLSSIEVPLQRISKITFFEEE